jgi:hypothetical protein
MYLKIIVAQDLHQCKDQSAHMASGERGTSETTSRTGGATCMTNDLLTPTITQLQELLTWPDGWNSYDALAPNPNSIARATAWITEVYQHLQHQWIEPNVTATGDGDVIFGWHYGQRDLDVYFDADEQSPFYITADGKGRDTKIEDDNITSTADMLLLWQWLLGDTQA